MLSGRVALGDFEVAFGGARKRFEELSAEVVSLTREQQGLLDGEARILEELARVYLPDLTPESVSAGLVELRGRLRDALEKQAFRLGELDEQQGRADERVAAADHRVRVQEEREAALAERVADARERADRALGADRDHVARVEEHAAIMERRAVLKERRARLVAAANVERRRYESHPPFAYLHRRRYGEPEYSGHALARALDGWLARRTGYPRLREKYSILLQGPHAIQAEVRKLTARAEELEELVDAREADAGRATGLLDLLAEQAAAQGALRQAREERAEAMAAAHTLEGERRAVAANRGKPWEEAVALHSAFLADQPTAGLIERARETPDPRDDALVEKLDRVRREIEEGAERLRALREELNRLDGGAGRVSELIREVVRRFTSRRSHFSEDGRVTELAESIFEGMLSPADAVRTLDALHVPTPLLSRLEGPTAGWLAELSSAYDPELGATTLYVTTDEDEEVEVIVTDGEGRVLSRRVTRRKGLPEG